MFKEDLYKNKKVLVSGGGTGIGFAIAKLYLKLGAHVVIAARKEERLKSAVSSLSEFGHCSYQVCDIRQTQQIKALSDYMKEEIGGLDILVNNAGGQFPSFAENISEKGWLAVINNNLNGTWFMTQILGKDHFIPQKGGVIINIIVNIFRGFPGMAHTGAARAGIDNFTKSLAVEWSKYNIRLNAVAPGIIQSSGLEQYPEEMKKGMAQKIPLKRIGSIEEVASLVSFLSSPMASYITGETVYIDGGWRLSGDLFNF